MTDGFTNHHAESKIEFEELGPEHFEKDEFGLLVEIFAMLSKWQKEFEEKNEIAP